MTTTTLFLHRAPLLRGALIACIAIGCLNHLTPDLLAQATNAPAPAGNDPQPGRWKIAIVSSLIFNHIDFVTVTIGLLSILSLTFIIRGFMETREAFIAPPASTERIREMIAQRKFQELVDYTANDPSLVSKAVNPALRRAPNFNAMKEAMETSLGEQTADAFRRIEILNIIGNLGPLLGLLGTVLGMIEAFDAMNRAGGNANAGQLAGGIATALAHTFLGLFLAIPTLAAFGILRTFVDRHTTRAAIISEELLGLMRPADGDRVRSTGGIASSPVVPPAPVSSAAVTPPRPRPQA